MNAHCERLIGTLRRECLDHVIVLSKKHAGRLLDEYESDYDAARCHQALGGDAPEPRVASSPSTGGVVGTPILGGLHHTDRRSP